MRDNTSWRSDLLDQLDDAGFPSSIIGPDAFCAIELGLHFLTTHVPGEPVGTLQPLLSGYVKLDADIDAVLRRVRHRMGDVGRRGYWRRLLNKYANVPPEWRSFARLDDPKFRVSDSTVFAAKPTVYCPERAIVYDAAMGAPLEYRPVRQFPAATAGERYSFDLDDGRVDHVQFPARLPEGPPIGVLGAPTPRRRQRVEVLFDDLERTASWIDGRLANRPDIRNRNWFERLTERVFFNAVDPNRAELVHRPRSFYLDGVNHIVGLMNSGKTTLTDLVGIDRVQFHQERVCFVVSSVGDVLAKVSFLRTLGIDAVPLIGNFSRTEHAGRYWRTVVEESERLVPESAETADPAAAYTAVACLLEPLRRHNGPGWKPLDPQTAPCRGSLRSTDGRNRRHDCPLLAVCPTQRAYRDVATAQVWVTTPQALLASRAAPSEVSQRWLEAVQPHMDHLIIDEADWVQQILDASFVQNEHLTGGPDGWSHRMVERTNSALAKHNMAPAADPEVQDWNEYLRIHEQAVFALNQVALAPLAQQLKELLGDAPFTAHSLWRRVTRTLFGLPQQREGDKQREDLADDFYREHVQDFAENPLGPPASAQLEAIVEALNARRRNSVTVDAALNAWIDDNAQRVRPDNESDEQARVRQERLERRRPLLRLIIEAAVWAGYISHTFFELSTMYPSIRAKLDLPDEERFWAQQPPRDYRPLIPEAPMGNILALRWVDSRNGGSLIQLLWVHGVGRWLLHHAHDLLACEGVDGPHVILTSATSWAPGSSFYHIPITPIAVLSQPADDREALLSSTMVVRNPKTGEKPIFVSGRQGVERHDGLRGLVSGLCLPVAGRHRSMIDELRSQLPADRQQILFVVLSEAEARIVGDHVNNRTPLTARVVVPDAADPGRDGILRRMVATFGKGSDDVLVAAEMSIQRGYNILNSNDTAALGAVIYLTRSHPPPYDLSFPLSLVTQLAIAHLQNPPRVSQPAFPGEVDELVKQLRADARIMWFDIIGRPVQFRALERDQIPAFVGNTLVPMSQTVGRSIRGNQRTHVLLCDAAFAPRLARDDDAPDTETTSIVLAMDTYLRRLLAAPKPGAGDDERRLHAINTAVWELMGHLIRTNDPLGTSRKGAS